VREYWPQITFVLLFTFALGGSYVELDTQADEIKRNTKSIEVEKGETRKISDTVIRMETNQKTMKRDLNEIKRLLEELRE